MVFLDDLIMLNQSPQELLRDLKTVCVLMMSLGFLINWKKTTLVPTQVIEYLGFTINSIVMEISLSTAKVKKVIATCREMLHRKQLSVRELAQLLGALTSTMFLC